MILQTESMCYSESESWLLSTEWTNAIIIKIPCSSVLARETCLLDLEYPKKFVLKVLNYVPLFSLWHI